MKKVRILFTSLALIIMLTACNTGDIDELTPLQKNDKEQVQENATSKEDDLVDPQEKEEIISDEGQDKDQDEDQDEEMTNEDKQEEFEPIDYATVKPNEIGNIMVVMYHGIMDNPPYHRTVEEFIKDLNYMYDNKYRPISMEDYLNNNIEVPAGYIPILLTFDDGLSSSFSLTEDSEGNLLPTEGTAVYIMEEFAKEHPDFGKAATFFINGDNAFNGSDGTYEERLQWLVNNGYSLGNHTASHAHLAALSAEEIQEEMAIVTQKINHVLPDYKVNALAYPFGERPLDFLDLVKEGEYNNFSYTNCVAFRVGFSAPFVGPNHIKFQPYNHPRVTASEGYEWDLWYAFDYYKENPSLLYVSDGNPNTIAIPSSKEQKVNKESIGNKELILY